jgi:hypothetical protein
VERFLDDVLAIQEHVDPSLTRGWRSEPAGADAADKENSRTKWGFIDTSGSFRFSF